MPAGKRVGLRLGAWSACVAAAAAVGAQTTQTPPPPSVRTPPAVSADAIWSPPPRFLETFHAACDRVGGGSFGDCFLAQMQKAGAPAAALAFARRTDGQGYLTALHEAGRVDVAFAEYPYRANENQVCFLVNGTPPWIDVDDLSRLDAKILRDDPDYAAIARAHPRVAIFPGPRGSARGPAALRQADGGQRFVVTYLLRDGCHACKVLGEAQLRFDFDVEGRLRGVSVQKIRPRFS